MTSALSEILEAKIHTPVYTMHKYFARRPWNVFNELISNYTSRGDIVLDPFCGGGVTAVESLKLGRKTIGVDLNPLATYVTEMECRPVSIETFQQALSKVGQIAQPEISALYRTACGKCRSDAVADWIEWDERKRRIIRLKYDCRNCGLKGKKKPSEQDVELSETIEANFGRRVKEENLWFPDTRIPNGDKTNSLLSKDINFFNELFTRRNLLALSILFKEVNRVEDKDGRDFLKFAFSSSLKWSSRQSHLRGEIVEGWAMHAYWIYPKSLEINVWNTFERRAKAIIRGKQYSNDYVGEFCKLGENFDDLVNGPATCLVLNANSALLPIPDNVIDAIITDPPYGGNVNYAELSDYWFIWMSEGKTIEKDSEVIINRTQGKGLIDYGSLLGAVLRECYRVLKMDRCLVSTFNSKDMRVVASFVTAASKAGFTLPSDGLLYQSPIRPYTTTFHAMQIGAFVGDFIFTFVKKRNPQDRTRNATQTIPELKEFLTKSIAEGIETGLTEPQLREKIYRILIPFLAENTRIDPSAGEEAVGFFEAKMKENEIHFHKLSEKITETRRRNFRGRSKAPA